MDKKTEEHGIAPVYDKNSKILILGSFPSVKSRETHFFYGHPQNRFWKVLSQILECELPITVEEKKKMLLSHGIAIWDVIARCEIAGSSDSSIDHVIPNDLSLILKEAPIKAIFTNGKKAYELYGKYCQTMVGMKAIPLPSTSPANAAYGIPRLLEAWKCIKEV